MTSEENEPNFIKTGSQLVKPWVGGSSDTMRSVSNGFPWRVPVRRNDLLPMGSPPSPPLLPVYAATHTIHTLHYFVSNLTLR